MECLIPLRKSNGPNTFLQWRIHENYESSTRNFKPMMSLECAESKTYDLDLVLNSRLP